MRFSAKYSLSFIFVFVFQVLWAHRMVSHTEMHSDYVMPVETESRLASGAPGPDYWQQQVDYVIEVEIDDGDQVLRGEETITYHNNSPHDLSYLWMELDQNAFSPDSIRSRGWSAIDFENKTTSSRDNVSFKNLRQFYAKTAFQGGYQKLQIRDVDGDDLPFTVVETNARIDLKTPLKAGEHLVLKVKWSFLIPDERHSFRNGFKTLEDGNRVYQVGQWYPRMCAYYDREGWQNRPYFKYGEFASEFGQFDVSIKVPRDFVVSATGSLQNSTDVLSSEMMERLTQAVESAIPVKIVTEEEAETKRTAGRPIRNKVWKFKAENVRDFAFACSRAYIWDAKGVQLGDKTVMAMSMYPREGSGIWSRYSTEAVAATIAGYSKHVFAYPYPVAWSTWGPIYGMEYPMMSFQSSFDDEDNGSYSLKARNYVIGVIIHEVGHNWFPMIINSDERKWVFMDEGLNTFVESLVAPMFDRLVAEKQMSENRTVLSKQSSTVDDPIVVQAETQKDRGYQGYRKPTVALTVLRELVMGRELFDFAFQEYGRRWAFKRPTPADYFRTMEDASGMDLGWFWKGWFLGNDHVDLALSDISSYRLESWEPEKKAEEKRTEKAENKRFSWEEHVHEHGNYTDQHEHLQDWYLNHDEFAVKSSEIKDYEKRVEKLEPWEAEIINRETLIHVIRVENVGGLISPFNLEIVFEDDSVEQLKVPASVWFQGKKVVEIPVQNQLSIKRIIVDKQRAAGDVDYSNNVYPREIPVKYFELKEDKENPNPMHRDMTNALWRSSEE